MEYLNIKLETVGDIRYVGSVPLVRATWLNLLIYSVKQENSGRIANCRAWGDHTWAQIAGLKKREVHAHSTLWDWDGDDLLVWGYPLHNEQVCQVRRQIGKQGGKASGASRRLSKTEANDEPNGEAIGSPIAEATLEQKGKESKGREENSTTTTTTALPGSIEEARAYAVSFSKGNTAGLDIPMNVVTQWWDDRESIGWETVKGGTPMPITDWKADLRKYATHFQRNETRPAGYSSPPRKKVTLTTETKGGW